MANPYDPNRPGEGQHQQPYPGQYQQPYAQQSHQSQYQQPFAGQYQQPYQAQYQQPYAQHPYVQHVVHQQARVPFHQKYGLNILLTIVTFGLWGLVWLGLAIYASFGGRGVAVGVGALILLSIAGGAFGGEDNSISPAVSEQVAQDESGVVAKPEEPVTDDDGETIVPFGQPAADGKFAFTVKNTECGRTNIGGQFGENADGVFCIVTVTVENVGDEARMFDGSNQTAYDGRGRAFEADAVAAIYLDDDANSFLNDINPGNKVTGKIVFDVPKGAKLTTIELHDSLFSGGVTAALR